MSDKRELNEDGAILALMTQGSIAKAARHCHVSEATLWRWMQDDKFREKYRTACGQVFGIALEALKASSVAAVDTLRRNLNCGRPSDENTAARALLDHGTKAVELSDLQLRLAALEAMLK